MGVDCGWKTGLGTCFYDREHEVGELEKLLGWDYTVIVVGPRNAGKSELVKYVMVRRLRVKPLIVDARRLSVEGSLAMALDRASGLDPRTIALEATRLGLKKLGLGELVRLLLDVVERLRMDPYLVVDETHHIASVRDLEAIAKMVAFYPEYSRVKLVVTSSEGFLTNPRVASRLYGYKVSYLHVSWMSERDMESLYLEYCSRVKCRVSLDRYLNLIGPLPGYLAEIAHLDGEGIEKWIGERRRWLESVLLNSIPGETGYHAASVVEASYKLLVLGLEPSTPLESTVARLLVDYNVAYTRDYRRYEPQLRIYKQVIEESARRLRAQS